MAQPDLARVLEEVLPKLQRLRLKAWFRLLVLSASGVTLAWILTDNGRLFHFALPVLALMLLLLVGFSAGVLRFGQQQALLPTVAAAFGMVHRKNDDDFITSLPRQLLPRAGRKYHSDDAFFGEIAGQKVRMAEVSAVSRKKENPNRREPPGFRGLVFELGLVGEVSPLMIADGWHTRPNPPEPAALDTEGAPQRDSFQHLRTTYALWAATDERQRSRHDLLEGLVLLAPEVFDQRAFLYSAVIEGDRLTIALSYGHNLFRLGGLFASRDRLMQELRESGDDLARMMRFATGALRLGQGLAGPAR